MPVRLGHSLACVGAKIWSSEKVNLGWYDSTSRSPQFVDQSLPDFFRQTPKKIAVDQVLGQF